MVVNANVVVLLTVSIATAVAVSVLSLLKSLSIFRTADDFVKEARALNSESKALLAQCREQYGLKIPGSDNASIEAPSELKGA